MENGVKEMARKSLLLALVFILIAALPVSAEKLLVDKILVYLEKDTITATDVEVEKAIVKYSTDSLLFPGKEAEMTDREVLKDLLVRELLFGQAVKLGLPQPDEKEMEARLNELASKFPSEAAYLDFCKKMEVSAPRFDKKMAEVSAWRHYRSIERRTRKVIMIEKVVAKKVGLQVKLTLSTEFAAQRDDLAKQTPGLSEQEYKDRLEKELFQKALSTWIKDVLSRSEIRILERTYSNLLD
jgi:hypothetical protein